MEYYGNTLCISAPELIETGIITQSNYKAMAARNRINVVRRGGGASGCTALIAVDSLPIPQGGGSRVPRRSRSKAAGMDNFQL